MKARRGSGDIGGILFAILITALVCMLVIPELIPARKNQEQKSGVEETAAGGKAGKVTAVQKEKPSEVVERSGYRIEYYLEAGLARIIVTQCNYDKTDANLGLSCSEEILQAHLEIRKKYFTSDPLPISTQINTVSATRVVIVSITPKIGE